MICVLCGEQVEDGEIVLELKQYRHFKLRSGTEIRSPVAFDDGTMTRFVHHLCPTEFGAPLALIGADGARTDV